MSQPSSMQSLALVAVTAAAVSLLFQACGGGAVAQTPPVAAAALAIGGEADPFEGVWESSIQLKDCASGAVIVAFKAGTLAIRGGALNADDSFPTTSRGAAFGNWRAGGGGAYSSNLRFMRYDTNGTVAGTQQVQRELTMAGGGNQMSGTVKAQIMDNEGVVLQSFCGSETAVRIY